MANLQDLLDNISESLDQRGEDQLAADIDIVVPLLMLVKPKKDCGCGCGGCEEANPALPKTSMPGVEVEITEPRMSLPVVPTGHEDGAPAPLGIVEPDFVPPAGLQPRGVPEGSPVMLDDQTVSIDPGEHLRVLLDNVAEELENRGDITLAASVDLTARNIQKLPGLGLPRNKMPQIKKHVTAAFLVWLENQGIKVQVGKTIPTKLKPTQNEIDMDRAKKMPTGTTDRPIMISRDDYVLDGHHRWMAYKIHKPDTPMRTIRINLPIRELLKKTFQFDKVQTDEWKATHSADIAKWEKVFECASEYF